MSEENVIRLKHVVIDMGDGTELELNADKARQLYAALDRLFGKPPSASIGGWGGGSNIREYLNCFPSSGEGIVEVKPWPGSSSDVATDDTEGE